MIGKITNSNIGFIGKKKVKDPYESFPDLDLRYTTAESKAKNVVILGSSKPTSAMSDSMELCASFVRAIVKNGKSIITGCGNKGAMGAAYYAAAESSIVDVNGKPLQNLAIVMTPPYGDENLKDCVVIGKAVSEPDRIAKFWKCSDSFVIFPGATGTTGETFALINYNDYTPKGNPLKKIILVGHKFFSPVANLIKYMRDADQLRHNPEDIFQIVETKKQALEALMKFRKIAK